MSGLTLVQCPDCSIPYRKRANKCHKCGRERDGKSPAEVAAMRADVRDSELEQLRFQRDTLTGVAVVVTANCCARCRADRGQWSFENVPKLPHPDCEDPQGCRCVYIGITKSMTEITGDSSLPDSRRDLGPVRS